AISGVALLALLIGMYLIHLTLSTTVIERTRRYGAMRAIGATRAQVRRTVLVEAAVVGAAGSAAGLLLGIAVGTVMVRVVAEAVLFGPLMRVLVGMAGRVSPAVWRVAVRQSGRERSRSATTLGLVMVVFALVLAVDSGVASVNNALQSELRRQFGADVRV